ncbi:signal transduction histidine kinase [Evansella vedderi]|uniref:histidine kinase n=1 Tax=Evansella vedderi TaxID=38282 RepID=A0ABT9ZYT7_9BACI|nr:histidine kinase [Evansella vedderi]MDQ0256416.1 signal transduction histidine kinase [Evansella vedderi]
MLFLFILLWGVGLLLIVFDPKRETTRWASVIAFAGGAGGLSVVIEENIKLRMVESISSGYMDGTLLFMEHILAFISHYVTPYGFLIFSITYSNLLSNTWKKYSKIILLTPIFLMGIFFPIYPNLIVPYAIASWWVTPYIICGIVLLIYAFIQEQHPSKKRQRLLVNLAFIPAITFALFTNYILRMMNIDDFWRYNYWIVSFATIVFFIGLIRYGFIGLKLQVQRQQYAQITPEINSGTALLNHVLKNDIKSMVEVEDLIKELEGLKSKKLTSTSYKFLSQLIFNWAERERKKLASDIHDSVLQDIIIVKRKIEEIKLVTAEKQPELENRVTELEEEILDIMFSMRDTCQELAPPLLAEMDLPHALHDLEEKFKLRSNSKLNIKFVKSPNQLLNNDYKLVVYRIVQELLNNANKHAKATEVIILIKIHNHNVELYYQDNGVGTDLSLINKDQKKIGLIGMAARVHGVGGYMKFNSEPNKGMNVQVEIPLK